MLSWMCHMAGFHTLSVWTAICYSLNENALCGLDKRGNGRYAIEGITALSEGLKGSSITSLR